MNAEASAKFIINPAQQVHGQEEIDAATKVLEAGFWAEGGYAANFKKDLQEFLGVRYSMLTNSGSSANLAALMALTTHWIPEDRRLKEGDEIITTALAFPTTISPIYYARAIPVFVDVESGTLNIDPAQEEGMISPKTKAIMVAHNLGNPFNLDAIQSIADKHNLWLIQDCCDAIGADWNGEKINTFGDVSTSSFYPAHHISTGGEGGAVYTDNSRIFRGLQSMINWGRDCFTPDSMVSTWRGCIPIKDIMIGDKVLTRFGYKDVNNVIVKDSRKEMLSIKAFGHKPIETTIDHKILVKKNDWEWIQAKNIKKGDLLRVESILENRKVLNKDIMYLSGLYLAEGGLIIGSKGPSGYNGKKYKYHAVEFNLCDDEMELVDELKRIVKHHYNVNGSVRKDKKHGLRLRFKSRRLYTFLSENFGTGSSKKFISNKILGSKDTIYKLVKGYIQGDGSDKGQGITLGSCNLGLITQVQSILNIYNIRAGFTILKRNKDIFISGKKVINAKPLYILNMYGKNRKTVERFMAGETVESLEAYEAPVEKIAKLNYQGPIYDLSIEGKHEYTVNGFVVHNCYCAPGCDNTCGKRYDWELGDLPKGYDHKNTYTEFGFNLKMTDIQAAIGIEQLKRLPGFIEARRENHAQLREFFSAYNGWFELPESYEQATPSWFGYVVKLTENAPFTRQQMVQALEENGIMSRAFFSGNVLKQPVFYGRDIEHRVSDSLEVSNGMMENSFWIGCHPAIGDEEMKYMKHVLANFLLNIGETETIPA